MSPQIPERIGRYQVQALLGHGGMGNVYLAVDPRLKRQLAIKTVRNRDDDDQDQTLERFSREAEISAQLDHPNIITIYDVGEDPHVGVFLAMEYVKGQSLAAHIRERRPGLEASLFLLVQAMRALQAAHDGAIIHRDIKPENMMVSDTGRLKLMDFGLARGNHSRLTATGMVMGTPSFTAPELMMGKEPGASTDRYAFYVTAFELLSGELPFKGDTLGSTLYRIVHEPPIIPMGMDTLLAKVFLKALSKNPEERFSTLSSFMLDLIQGCTLSPPMQSKLLGLVEAEFSSQSAQAPEGPSLGSIRPDEGSSDIETQVVQTPQGTPTFEASLPIAQQTLSSPALKLPAPPKPASAQTRHTGPPLRLPMPTLLARPGLPRPLAAPTLTPPGTLLKAAAYIPPVPKMAPPIPKLKVNLPAPPPPTRTAIPDSPLPPANAPEGPLPQLLLAAPTPPQIQPPPPLAEVPPGPGPVESLFDFEGGPIDDPFEGLDWDSVLAPQRTAAEILYDDLETSLGDINILEAEARAEEADAQEQVKALEDMLGGLSSFDIMEAEERAEAEEAIHDLESALAKADLPEMVEAPTPPPLPRVKPPRKLLPPPPEFGH